MKAKVTKALAARLRSEFLEKFPGYRFSYETYTQSEYQRYVDYDLFRHEEDFDYKTGMMKVIRVSYPDEYYACPRHLTTRDVQQAARRGHGTMEGFLREIENTIAI